MSVLITVNTNTYETRHPSPGDKWDRGDTRGEVVAVRAHYSEGDQYDPIHYRAESFDVPGATPGTVVYAVIADYETGDTFGRRGGSYQILDVFTDSNEAYDLASVAKTTRVFSFEWNGTDYYADWVGYFERLQDIRVWTLVVEA